MSNVCEEQIFSKVFKTHSKTVFNYIFYKFGNEEKANDAVQEAFVKLWQNCAKVSPEKEEYKEKLDNALNALPENQRTTFLLNRIDGKKYAEIAEMEEVSVKAIEKRMQLALKSLRKHIDGI